MARGTLPYYNASEHGQGIEGVANYTNILVDNLFLPTFLLVLYGLSIYVISKSDYKLGSGITFVSLIFFLMSIIAQTFVTLNQIVVFIFFVGIIAGIVISFIEGN